MAIRIRDKRFAAVGESVERHVLHGLEIDMASGEFVAVVGPSGCGKTTMLNIVAGLDDDYDGSIDMANGATGEPSAIGYVFQTPRLLPWRTVRQNIEIVLPDSAVPKDRVEQLLQQVGLGEFAEAYPDRLSVGMRRRVGLARAFAVDPSVLLMDEPFVSIDSPTARRLRLLLLDVWAARPTAVLFVTHDLREAIMLADRIVFLSPSPATALGDVVIDIPRRDRVDEPLVERFRERLIADFSDLVAHSI